MRKLAVILVALCGSIPVQAFARSDFAGTWVAGKNSTEYVIGQNSSLATVTEVARTSTVYWIGWNQQVQSYTENSSKHRASIENGRSYSIRFGAESPIPTDILERQRRKAGGNLARSIEGAKYTAALDESSEDYSVADVSVALDGKLPFIKKVLNVSGKGEAVVPTKKFQEFMRCQGVELKRAINVTLNGFKFDVVDLASVELPRIEALSYSDSLKEVDDTPAPPANMMDCARLIADRETKAKPLPGPAGVVSPPGSPQMGKSGT